MRGVVLKEHQVREGWYRGLKPRSDWIKLVHCGEANSRCGAEGSKNIKTEWDHFLIFISCRIILVYIFLDVWRFLNRNNHPLISCFSQVVNTEDEGEEEEKEEEEDGNYSEWGRKCPKMYRYWYKWITQHVKMFLYKLDKRLYHWSQPS